MLKNSYQCFSCDFFGEFGCNYTFQPDSLFKCNYKRHLSQIHDIKIFEDEKGKEKRKNMTNI